MRNLFNEYLFVRNRLKSLEVSNKTYLIGQIMSFILSALIFSGPIAIMCNLMIYIDWLYVIGIGLGILLGLVFTFTKIFYYKYVFKDKKIEKIGKYYLIDSIINISLCILMVILFIV